MTKYNDHIFDANYSLIIKHTHAEMPNMGEASCYGHCLQTKSCDAVIMAYDDNWTDYMYRGCAGFKLHDKDYNLTDVVNATWISSLGDLPNISQLIIIGNKKYILINTGTLCK